MEIKLEEGGDLDDPLIGSSLGRYKILGLVGRGGRRHPGFHDLLRRMNLADPAKRL